MLGNLELIARLMVAAARLRRLHGVKQFRQDDAAS
ncbi:hypothetical protein B0G80_7681 [Paraburkholderia sp. BL6669N2]|nr:hypothetical protein B0G80_7681 [Paraburkholderia sp. BL6669N2]